MSSKYRKDPFKINSIMPAEDWIMIADHDGKISETPLVCWANCEDENGTPYVTGMINAPMGHLVACSTLVQLTGYYRKCSNSTAS